MVALRLRKDAVRAPGLEGGAGDLEPALPQVDPHRLEPFERLALERAQHVGAGGARDGGRAQRGQGPQRGHRELGRQLVGRHGLEQEVDERVASSEIHRGTVTLSENAG